MTRTINSDAAYQFDYSYNGLGQLDTLTYPTSTAGIRFKTKYGYTAGYLTSVQEYTGNVNGTVLWNLNLLDARLNAISETYGNGLWLQNGFDAATGEPLTRQSGTGGQAANVQNLSYVWDDAGNLSSRQDLRQALTESFTYDALDRLTLASGPGAQSTSIGYDAIGNITSKTGVGTYTYHTTRKHAVVSAGGSSYSYDGNGNLISRSGATVTWSSYNLPTYLADPSGYSAQFWYAPDRSRWKQVSSYAGATETTIYVGGLLEKFTNAVGTHWKHLIPTPSGQVQVIRRSSGVNDTLYVTTDHLGSTDAVLNAAGTVLMAGSFDVHGKRRASNWQGAPSTAEWQAIAATTRRGYTGHEHLDNVMLIHMNGRVFDPVIGRFLSADPYIDGLDTTQGWNRYAYVQGRTVSVTDPSGFKVERGFTLRHWINANEPSPNQSGTSGSDSIEHGHTESGLEEVILNYANQTSWTENPSNQSSGPISGPTGDGRGGGGNKQQPKKRKNDKCSSIVLRVSKVAVGTTMVIGGGTATVGGVTTMAGGVAGAPGTFGGSLGMLGVGGFTATLGAASVLDGGQLIKSGFEGIGGGQSTFGMIGSRYGGQSGGTVGDYANLVGFAMIGNTKIGRVNLGIAMLEQVVPMLDSVLCEED